MSSEIGQKIDKVREAGNFEEAFKLAQDQISLNPNDCETLWRLARANYDLSENRATQPKEKESYIDKGLQTVKKALELNEQSAGAHKWFAILTSAKGDFLGTKEKIQSAFVIKEHALKAAQLDPSDSAAQYLLGRWCFDVADIGWLARKAAAAFFSTPPESSFAEALPYFLKADQLASKSRKSASSHGEEICSTGFY
eukprot:Sdes_comp17389_c0_seq1m6591